jgi:UDP-N-acetyl-D-mannosaminuronic acid dehydrogenase
MEDKSLKIAVIGGAGHVGLPLSLLFAKKGFDVFIIDSDSSKIEMLERGEFPFMEEGGEELLCEITEQSIIYSTEHKLVSECDVIILTVGTPVDEHLNPKLTPIFEAVDQIKPYMHNDQVIILRSTLFPGMSEKIHAYLQDEELDVGVSFCPERIAQGKALFELRQLPQIISGSDKRSLEVARALFSVLTTKIVELEMIEAEIAKLFSNAWRYIKFSIVNQLYMIADEKGLDFYRIREAMTYGYGRAFDFPSAGFAAGPCLFKDTMQLASYSRHNFTLGHAAMLVNETLPDFLVHEVKKEHRLKNANVGILGMAFKADNDDFRESLSYKLKKILEYEGANVFCTDPYVKDERLVKLENMLEKCEIIFVGCPHSIYRNIEFTNQKVIDCWGLYSNHNSKENIQLDYMVVNKYHEKELSPAKGNY